MSEPYAAGIPLPRAWTLRYTPLDDRRANSGVAAKFIGVLSPVGAQPNEKAAFVVVLGRT